MTESGRSLQRYDDADMQVLGCAAMAHYHAELELRLDVPVVYPCHAATALEL